METRGVLSRQLVVATVVVSLLVSFAVSALLLAFSYRSQTAAAEQRLDEIGASIVPSLANNLWNVDFDRLDMMLDGLAQLPAVAYLELDGDVGPLRTRGVATASGFAERTYELYFDAGGEVRIGSLRVVLSDSAIIRQLLVQALAMGFAATTALVVSALLLLWRFQSGVTRHLEHLATYLRGLSFERLETPLALHRQVARPRDELDDVVDSINRMRETMRADLQVRLRIEAELDRHREHLEDMVATRTHELSDKTRQLQLQSAELAERNQDLEAYAQTVAHDLKTPLAAIVGHASLLDSRVVALTAEKSRETAGLIHRTARKMASIIDALLLMANVRRSEGIVLQPVDSAALVAEAMHRLQPFAVSRGAQIALPATWPQAMGQPEWVEEIWANYLSNAIKYGGDPPRIELGSDTPERGSVRFWVRDHGPGIAAEQRARLFNDFERIDPHAAEGHGLGLSIVRRIASRLGGEAGVEVLAEGGARFWFTLPVASATQLPATAENPPHRGEASGEE
ncbi:MAG TPA: ATP-binding protein [Arenimonas sp.]|nr:ATP-binding protein [Arenimonas sp.]